MTFVWLLPAALHSGAPVSLSLVDRCCAVSSHVGTRGVVGGVDVEDGARRRAGGAGVRARGDDLRKHHTGFLLNGRGVGVDVNPPDAAVVGVALCFRCLGSCSMAPIVALISRCGASDSYPPKKPGGGRASGRIKSRGRREPGEWVGELTSCLTAVYDETNLLETNLLVSRHSVCSRVLSNLSRAPTCFLLPYYPGIVVSKLTYPSLKKPKGYFKRIVQRYPDIQIV